jgi:5-enolpyruvylshikimate-3-phosphate synthase
VRKLVLAALARRSEVTDDPNLLDAEDMLAAADALNASG